MSIIEQIFEYPFLTKIFNNLLNNNDKLNLICNKHILSQRHKLKFNEMYYCTYSDKNKWYFNCLTNILISEIFEIPTSVTNLQFDSCFRWRYPGIVQYWIPKSITNLHLGWNLRIQMEIHCYNEEKERFYYESCIPYGITHLHTGNFNQRIYNFETIIPNSVKFLTFGQFFDQEVDDLIINNVTHLTFGRNFNQKINNLLKRSSSITNLKLGEKFDQKISSFPLNLKYLIVSRKFLEINNDLIFNNIVIIIIK